MAHKNCKFLEQCTFSDVDSDEIGGFDMLVLLEIGVARILRILGMICFIHFKPLVFESAPCVFPEMYGNFPKKKKEKEREKVML